MTSEKEHKLEQASWVSYSDEELLKLRICDLNLDLLQSGLEPYANQLYGELEAKGLKFFRPVIYLGDEWFSQQGYVAISVPFFLAHPRLRALEKKMMLEVEGDTDDWFMKLLRHEAGHCFDHAYKFSKEKKWQKVFGQSAEDYDPDNYLSRPYSRSFVRHLDNWYAQAHPDEDFAETFAVWLTPESDWANKYGKWKGALNKLHYLEELAKSVAEKKVSVRAKDLPYSVSRLRKTLAKYYAYKRKFYAQDFPDFFDLDLRAIFNGAPELSRKEFGASGFLRRNLKTVISMVTRWSGAHKYTVDAFINRLSERSKEIDLKLGKSESETLIEFVVYVASMVTHYIHTGNFKRTTRWQKT